MKTVTQSYLDAIRDERAILESMLNDGFSLVELAGRHLESAIAARAMVAPDTIDYANGVVDFWRNQVKRLDRGRDAEPQLSRIA